MFCLIRQQAREQRPETGRENWKGSVVHDLGLFHLGQGQQACVVNMRNKVQLEGIAIWFEDQARTLFKFVLAHFFRQNRGLSISTIRSTAKSLQCNGTC